MFAIVPPVVGGPEVLTWAEVSDPSPNPDEVVIEVVAAGVNRADLLQRKGFYPPPPGASEILGLECSGTIVEVGRDVRGWRIGESACALLAGGGYAQRVAVPAVQLLPVPRGVSVEDAAALPEVACTAWSNLLMEGGLQRGQFVLVRGGTGGVGTHAIQIARVLGAHVVATVRNDAGSELCMRLGAAATARFEDELHKVVSSATGGQGLDLILDNLGGDFLQENVSLLKRGGRVVVIGLQKGVRGQLDLQALMAKSAWIGSTNLRSRPSHGSGSKAEVVNATRENVWPFLEDGSVVAVVHRKLPMSDAASAHRMLERGGVMGKIILLADQTVS
ncbi:NAD(P)H-quinone oxidoreductase [Actinoplanes sp. KI2]|uniref:NAD(P)H-quinone oxidoreductase n=1 Tax=Actinoplanes sp. KI2 TaxID=2983315 RepID=UPI0021D5990C|nr:NAD(P)H-quinone oxidoreductase [Actinoplanes sp. KI2]MCU7725247.1 NAD(P)H-quinone oxidoreductase [Actinoplanes sp. KI2]